MSLRKGATFHSPTTPPLEVAEPTFTAPLMPKRAQTCPKSLEDVIAAGEKRMAALIGSFDRSLSGIGPISPGSEATLHAEDLPVPRIVLDATVPDFDLNNVGHRSARNSSKFTGRNVEARKHHSSDSGIGSTVSGTVRSLSEDGDRMEIVMPKPPSRTRTTIQFMSQSGLSQSTAVPSRTPSAITRSLSSLLSPKGNCDHILSYNAKQQIRKYIIIPILQQAKLKDFHKLVHDVPRRIEDREITCLRDLEKTLIFLAPVSMIHDLDEMYLAHVFCLARKELSISKQSYLRFCETSIHCIQVTVDHLGDRDQRRPTDRPYTDGYFLDLVEQIKQYATMMAESKEKLAKGEKLHEQDFSPDEKLSLQGGLSQNGQPAQLVRTKNGKHIAIGSESVSMQGPLPGCESSSHRPMKRSLSEDTMDDDEVHRSMARRRKSAQTSAKDLVQTCSECKKAFKRPCDLTKHEKTHSRPWKCFESNCKYHGYGWPTEKERDRHVNDKHSNTPALFECQYHPCTYKSKRESNCKQHMEKAHGWTYVRSKNNGRTTMRASVIPKSATPDVGTPNSYSMGVPTPTTGNGSSPYMSYEPNDCANSISGSASDSEDIATYPNGSELEYPVCRFNEQYAPIEQPFSFNDYNNEHLSTAAFELSPISGYHHRHSVDTVSSAMTNAPTLGSSFTPEEPELSLETLHWPNMEQEFGFYNEQLPTPYRSVEPRSYDNFTQDPCIGFPQAGVGNIPCLSPGAQANVMLYSPHSVNDVAADEGYEDFIGDSGKPTTDFALFSSTGESSVTSASNEAMFQDMSTLGGQFGQEGWSQQGVDLAHFGLGGDMMQLDDFEQ
ncbi:MAG: copper-binding transcription factor [Pycnora praestabilis]|nr:MAG: copper-binding transcription factor [Pycnora praestabilis]